MNLVLSREVKGEIGVGGVVVGNSIFIVFGGNYGENKLLLGFMRKIKQMYFLSGEELAISDYIAVVSILIGLSGWVTFLYNWFTSKPNIKGRIFNVITGDMKDPSDPTKTLTAFNVYLYLTNTRKNTIHILDYELEVDTGNGYEKTERVYGAHKIPNWSFSSQTHDMRINDYPKKLITATASPLEQGFPLYGFVLFASRKQSERFKEHAKKYKVTCIDALNNRHKIVSCPKQFPNVFLFQDLAGIELTPKKV